MLHTELRTKGTLSLPLIRLPPKRVKRSQNGKITLKPSRKRNVTTLSEFSTSCGSMAKVTQTHSSHRELFDSSLSAVCKQSGFILHKKRKEPPHSPRQLLAFFFITIRQTDLEEEATLYSHPKYPPEDTFIISFSKRIV